MIAIYNPNSDPTLQNLPLPTNTEIAEFEDIAWFLELLDSKRNQIEQIILSNWLLFQWEEYATSENIATVKRLLPHTNHHRQIIRSTYGNKFSGKKIYDNWRNEQDYDIRWAHMIAKLLVKNYSNTSPNDVGDLVGTFAGKVNPSV
jgi:hypothetical protein